MKNLIEVEIELLAQTDALFHPGRYGLGCDKHVVGIYEIREVFCEHGFLYRAGGSEQKRKEGENSADELEKSGAVIFRRYRGRRTRWKLSDSEDWRLRRSCTWSDYEPMLVLMYAVQAHESAGYGNEGFVPEWTLSGVTDSTDDTKANYLNSFLEEIASAGLCRNLIESKSDGHGAVGYRLSDTGREFLRNPAPPAIDWPEYVQSLNDFYFHALDEARESLKSVVSAYTNHVCSRLSRGTWPEDSKAAKIPAVFVKDGKNYKVRTIQDMRRKISKLET